MNATSTTSHRRNWKDLIGVAARGFCMGAADIVPGVSGGTMAFILGIYEELLHALHAFNLDFLRRLFSLRFKEAFAIFPWRFLLALGLGIVAAIFTLAEGLHWALQNHPEFIWAFFFGLVLASTLVVYKRVSLWTPWRAFALAAAAASSYTLFGLVPVETPNAPWFLFLSGAVAVCAMILPGISGAFILVLLGKYQHVLNAVVNRDLITLALVVSGAALGLLTFARLLRWLFKHHHDLTIALLMGLMIGALRKVWPWKQILPGADGALLETNVLPAAMNLDAALTLAAAIFGLALVLVLENLAARHSTPANS
jgi:putative membrane protein